MAVASHPQALPRGRRLQRPSEFSQVRNLGQRMVVGCLILNWKEAPATRLGVVTSRRIGGSVARSRARRLLRECFRQRQSELTKTVEMVLVARRSIDGRKMAKVEIDFLTALKRAGLLQGQK